VSIIMTMRMKGDGKRLEEIAAQNPERVSSISERAKEAGVIAHRFYATDDGQMMVIDEWPDEQSFQSFFEAEASNIQPLMQETGVTQEPEISFWHKLETGDAIGWGA
jgi:heme-degrading monooxygenase HmoA